MRKLILFAGVVGVSFSAIFVRYSTTPPIITALCRMALAALIMLPFVLLRRGGEFRKQKLTDILPCVLSGVFLGLHFCAYFEALEYTSIAAAVTLVDTEMFFVAAGMFIILREKVAAKSWPGMILAFVGSVVIALSDAAGGSSVKGDIFAVAGAVFMAGYTVIGRLTRRTMSTALYTFFVYASGALTLLFISLLCGVKLFGYGIVNLWTGLGMAIVCTLLGHSVFSWGLKYEKASYIAVIKLLEPVFASILGVVLLSEYPRLTTVLGGIAVIAGIWYCTIIAGRETKK
ncbi:MAG: DMT family transporter [Oscillospiraceae bacterium]